MALIRRSGARFTANIWPGFVDAMTAILLVLMFVLSIFMIVQSVLRDTISGQNSELTILSKELSIIRNKLTLEQERLLRLNIEYERKLFDLADVESNLSLQKAENLELDNSLREKNSQVSALEVSLEALENKLITVSNQLSEKKVTLSSLEKINEETSKKLQMAVSASEERLALLSALRLEYNAVQTKVKDFETKVFALLARDAAKEARLKDATVEIQNQISNRQMAELALAKARDEIDQAAERARLSAAKTEALEALVAKFKADQLILKQKNSDLMLSVGREKNASEKLKVSLSEKEKQIAFLARDIREKDQMLDSAANEKIVEQAAIADLKRRLEEESEEISVLTLALESERQKAMEILALLASAESVKDKLKKRNTSLDAEKTSAEKKLEAKKLALQEARAQILREKNLTSASILEVTRLKNISAGLIEQIADLQQILDTSELREKENKVQIESLGNRLNRALAQVASEQKKRAEMEAKEVERLRLEANDLKNYRSEFFGRLRKILGNKTGIEIAGDRFVFSSEVLFEPGSATLGADGKIQLGKVASVIREVAGDIPKTINWILRVDGHTDIQPLAETSRYSDNWELSQARALSVVKYLITSEGLEPRRLAAAGFGEYQPIFKDSSEASLASNRRIELKLTER
ncbi:MAG: peptidoglycan -binding protein [Pseudomonadota bacterium]|nr:peptidoglycan -binding protein [Pseudomonadota bacterium]